MALLIFVHGRRAVRYLWGVFSILVSMWGFGLLGISLTEDPGRAQVLWRILTVLVTLIPVVYFHLVLRYLHVRRAWLLRGLYGIVFLMAIGSRIEGGMVRDVRFAFDQLYYLLPGPLFIISTGVYFGVFAMTLWQLYVSYQASHGIERSHLR